MMNNDIQEILCSQQQIKKLCQELGQQISRDYKGKKPMIIGVLKGAMPFMMEVIKHIDIYMTMDFIDVSSYNGGTESSGHVKLIKDIDSNVQGRDVIFIDDIMDTGLTIDYLLKLFRGRGARSLKTCTLFNKDANRQFHLQPDYYGFDLPDKFVVGFGLDYQNLYRNLPYVGVLKPRVYQNK